MTIANAKTTASSNANAKKAPLVPTGNSFDHIDDALCRSFQDHIEVIGRKWTSGILLAGMRGATRFSEYRAFVTGISDRLLSQRFRELELEDLIERRVTPTSPVLIEYRPTERAVDLMNALQPLVQFGVTHPRDERATA